MVHINRILKLDLFLFFVFVIYYQFLDETISSLHLESLYLAGCSRIRFCDSNKNFNCSLDSKKCECAIHPSQLYKFTYSPLSKSCIVVSKENLFSCINGTTPYYTNKVKRTTEVYCRSHDDCHRSQYGNHSRCNPDGCICECLRTSDDNERIDIVFSGNHCYLRKVVGDKCSTDQECDKVIDGEAICDKSKMSSKTEGTCRCAANHVWNNVQHKCAPIASRSSKCETDEQCTHENAFGPMAKCNKNSKSCICENSAQLNGGKCFVKIKFNNTCSCREECLVGTSENSDCINSKCQCVLNYVWDKDISTCLPLQTKLNNSTCISNIQCLHGEALGSLSRCIGGTCKCIDLDNLNKTVGFDEQSMKCIRKAEVNEPCKYDKECSLDGDKYAFCHFDLHKSICDCKNGSFWNNSTDDEEQHVNRCLKIGEIGSLCETNSQCHQGLGQLSKCEQEEDSNVEGRCICFDTINSDRVEVEYSSNGTCSFKEITLSVMSTNNSNCTYSNEPNLNELLCDEKIINKVLINSTYEYIHKTSHMWILGGILLLVLLLLVLPGAIGVLYKKKFRKILKVDEANVLHPLHENQVNLFSGKFLPIEQLAYTIDDNNSSLGSGQSSRVYRGHYDGKEVAIKMTHIQKQSVLEQEINILSYLEDNENIIKFFGYCLRENSFRRSENLIILEVCKEGDLRKYLHTWKHTFVIKPDELNSNSSTQFTVKDLLNWSIQIAQGMEFLVSMKVIHCDLAARNILLYNKNCIKISDFGLARKLDEDDLTYVKTYEERLPWKWLAIEAFNSRTFSPFTDVWAYGITLVEIFSLGEEPYPGVFWSQNFVQDLESGVRPNRPSHASFTLYKLMKKCWTQNPNERIDFTQLKLELAELARRTISTLDQRCSTTEYDGYLIPI